MKITHLTENNLFDPDANSGTPYWISKALSQQDITVENLHVVFPMQLLPPLEEFIFRCKQRWHKFYDNAHRAPDLLTRRAEYIASTLKKPLENLQTDVILSSLSPLATAFVETKTPIVYWTDALYAGLVSFYPEFRFHHPDTMWDGHAVTQACLRNAKLLLFSSQWAARTAFECYGISQDKIRVAPFGANVEVSHSIAEMKDQINARATDRIKFLFVGKNWYRKGGDIVLKVLQALHAAGQAVELTIVGCTLDKKSLPPYVKCVGMLSKKNQQDLDKLKKCYQEAHFLFVPSRAEAYGIVFCEANAFAVPCLTTHVGGIPEIVKDGVNGMTFSLEATVQQYGDYIMNLMSDRTKYEALALSAFNEYQTRLNWQVASRHAKQLILDAGLTS